jgi:hypothetical protein
VSAHRVSHLRVLDGDGNVTEFASVEEENEGLRSALSRAEKVIRNLRAELQDNRAKARKKFPIDLVFTDWQDAMVGMAANPYVIYGKRRANGTRDDVDVDLTTVCKEAKRFEEACRLGFVIEHARNANQA